MADAVREQGQIGGAPLALTHRGRRGRKDAGANPGKGRKPNG
jgi:hypothetical protein